jgi:hypothetical protein
MLLPEYDEVPETGGEGGGEREEDVGENGDQKDPPAAIMVRQESDHQIDQQNLKI